MQDKRKNLRTIHARALNQKEVVADLPDFLRAVATAYARDERDSRYIWARENMPAEDMDRLRAALSEQKRQAGERSEAQTLCSRGDELALRSMYPGRAAYYDMVTSPPQNREYPTDAIVVIELGAGSLVRKAKAQLDSGTAKEVLKVQYGGSPNRHAKRANTESFFMGYYTPEIVERLSTPRPDCNRLPKNGYAQAACRRDITLTIVRDWLKARDHRSVRFLVSHQSAWPHYDRLIKQSLSEFDTCIDTHFDKRLSRKSSFLIEMCMPPRRPEMWIDYDVYVNTLFPDR